MHHGVVTFALADWVDPGVAFSTLFAGRPGTFWLDSGIDASSGRSFMGESREQLVSSTAVDDVLDAIAADQKARALPAGDGPGLGWVGWLGYEARAVTMGEPVAASRHPVAAFLRADRVIVFDHERRSVELVGFAGTAFDEWCEVVVDVLRAPVRVAPLEPHNATVAWAHSDDEYLAMIASCKQSITDGDAYQLCLTTEATVDVAPDPLAAYLAVRASSPTHHGAFIRIDDTSLLSASPEQFLTVSPEGIVESSPIKGTRPRGSTSARDAQLAQELRESDKERAENLMIVDLMRNDIGRISAVGSVSVPRLLEVESYAHVHQLVSTVRGQLADGLGAMDAVRSCFPAGSMTGAPKRRATQLLAALERKPRGIYSGVFGMIALDGSVDLAMVIRSIILDGESATIGTGGGITALSVPHEELAEAKLKAAALLRVLTTEG